VVIGSEFVDNIMMSPKYWNLPKPALIISITGSAVEFKPDQALSADDVPYVMFSLFNLKQPENKIFVPENKIFVPVRKSDCLSDVLFRLSDFSACRGTSDPLFFTISRSLRNLGGFVSKSVDLEEPDSVIETLEFKQEGKTFTIQPPVIFSEKENPFEKFLNSLDLFSTVDVTVHVVPGAKKTKFKLFRVVKAIQSAEVFEDIKSEEGTHLWTLPVFKDDRIGDLKRRIENRSLETVNGSDLKCPTLPQPFWRASTLILYNETSVGKKQTKLLQESQFDDLQKLSEEEFKNKNIEFFLLRTQGSGCHLDDEVVDRILHEVAFLLPLTFGSIWIIDGGSSKGIMKVTFVSRWFRLFPDVLIPDLR
jgi:hypothetical protein